MSEEEERKQSQFAEWLNRQLRQHGWTQSAKLERSFDRHEIWRELHPSICTAYRMSPFALYSLIRTISLFTRLRCSLERNQVAGCHSPVSA